MLLSFCIIQVFEKRTHRPFTFCTSIVINIIIFYWIDIGTLTILIAFYLCSTQQSTLINYYFARDWQKTQPQHTTYINIWFKIHKKNGFFYRIWNPIKVTITLCFFFSVDGASLTTNAFRLNGSTNVVWHFNRFLVLWHHVSRPLNGNVWCNGIRI